jgi:hypothetical protein
MSKFDISKFKIVTAVTSIVVLAIVFWGMWGAESMPESSVQNVLPASSKESIPLANLSEKEKLQQAKVNYLRKTYEKRIGNAYWQLKMIDKLMSTLKKEFPLDWEDRLISLLKEAFPDYADALINKLHAHLEYIAWFDSLKTSVTFENRDDRRHSMWNKRLELFGEEAYQIWEAALKQDKFDDHMSVLAKSSDSFIEKSEEYLSGVKAVFGDNVLDTGHKTQMLGYFLNLENVQHDLMQMTVETRRTQLKVYRLSMGLDDEALERWDSLDKQRDALREVGNSYSQKRDQLAKQYKGKSLSQKIRALQVDMFGEAESNAIQNEEATGYYRYTSPQKFGFN